MRVTFEKEGLLYNSQCEEIPNTGSQQSLSGKGRAFVGRGILVATTQLRCGGAKAATDHARPTRVAAGRAHSQKQASRPQVADSCSKR